MTGPIEVLLFRDREGRTQMRARWRDRSGQEHERRWEQQWDFMGLDALASEVLEEDR